MGPDMDMKFHQEVMEIVSYDTGLLYKNSNSSEKVADPYQLNATIFKDKARQDHLFRNGFPL